MICVTVSRPRHRFMLAECKGMSSRGADLVELRIDSLQTAVNLKLLLTDRPCPVIVTCRRPSDGGNYKRPESERLVLLRTAVFEGADYVDLEYDIVNQVPRYGKTKRIVSYHNFKETPDNLEKIIEQMKQSDADYLKVCTMANSPSDNVRMLHLIEQSTIPMIGFCMGEFGIPSRILCGAYGSPWTYACAESENAVAPGQIPFDQLKDLYQYNYIKRKTPVYGVIADPVGHSMSPLIHNSAYVDQEVDAVYVPFKVLPEQLEHFITQDAESLNVHGLSVTIPHKEAVIPFLNQRHPSIDKIGACNTIVYKEGQRLGYNTDYQASMDAISGIFNWQEPLKIVESDDSSFGRCEQEPLAGKTVLMLGAGGVGKALAIGLRLRGAELFITDIDAERAAALASRVEGHSIDWENRNTLNFDLMVNCTPVGMYPKVDASPYNSEWMKDSTAARPLGAFDCVYNPEQTLFLKSAQEHGWKIASGLDMFARQAQLQYELFLEQPGPAEVMRNAVRKATEAARW